ncbi:hypothetical protein EVAR_23350_1 [Eumeta japonica]|uniref:Uncharacterized protein n=1 Tax=Eumeta variegata TaxID=151549 RepID=A0A4C1Y0X3_EUMVA|nr:hypothetical protein EVAR_23350_1 [Eumeta japonica]
MPFHIRTRERIEDKPVEGLRLSEDDPPFTMVELKAPINAWNWLPHALEDRTCRHNTETWKEDYTLPKSYRPIGLLPIQEDSGKINDRPNQWHMLPSLSPKQYGFMPQRSTEDALYDLVNHVKRR